MPREPCAFVQVNVSVDLAFCNYASSGFILIQKKTKKPHRNSHPEVFYKKGVLRNFAKFTGKHLFQKLFSNRVAGLSQQLY